MAGAPGSRQPCGATSGPEFGWRQWEYGWTPSREAYYTILARARDAAGNTQPFDQEWNPSGYGWNVVPRVGVNVVTELSDTRQRVQPERRPASHRPPHSRMRASPAMMTTSSGNNVSRVPSGIGEINKMIGWGASVKDEDRRALLDYLFSNFGPRPR